MTLSKIFGHLCIIVGAVALAAAPAAGAETDPERALRSLWSIPLDAAGDAIAAGGRLEDGESHLSTVGRAYTTGRWPAPALVPQPMWPPGAR